MTDFTQPERDGLNRTQRSQHPHPDADLLAGFSEQTLPRREREHVLAHLAVCALCREVVYLAGAAPTEAVVSRRLQQSVFWKWPVVRWGAVAATAVIVAIAVSIGIREQPAPAPLDSDKAVMPAERYSARTDTASPAEMPASPGLKAPQIRYEKVEPQAANTMAGATLGQLVPPAKKLDVASSDRRAERKTAPASSAPLTMRAAPTAPPALEQAETLATTKNASSSAPAAMAMTKAGRGSHASADGSPAGAGEVQWQVTREGYLLSSKDLGHHWTRQLLPQRFTHVQTVGMQVWAAATGGRLMHSSDGGLHWTQVIPRDQTGTLQGDIAGIAFANPWRGTITTARGEKWVTADAGMTWKKQ